MTSGHFLTIESDECRRLLADAQVGRIGWNASVGMVFLPVNYGMDGQTVVFRVAEGTVLAELALGVEAVFQVDDLDADTATGWSVLARGVARLRQAPAPVMPCAWAPGERSVLLEFVPHSLTGRSVSAD